MRSSLVSGAVLVCLGMACDTPPAGNNATHPVVKSDCLTIDDVLNIPPGDARGSGFLGDYKPVSVVEESCAQCAMNEVADTGCGSAFIRDAVTVAVTQTEGLIVFDDGEVIEEGGINQDGTFRAGAVVTPTRSDGVKTGQTLVLLEGRIVGDDIVGTITWRLTGDGPPESPGTSDVQGVNRVTLERVNVPCMTSYRVAEWGFGFNPPARYSGPFNETPSHSAVVYQDAFNDGLLDEIEVGVAQQDKEFLGFVADFIERSLAGGVIFTDRVDFTMASGRPGLYLEDYDPLSDSYGATALGARDRTQFVVFHIQLRAATPADVREALLSLCVE